MDSELRDALDRWDSKRSEHVIRRPSILTSYLRGSDDVDLFVEAARKVANGLSLWYCIEHGFQALEEDACHLQLEVPPDCRIVTKLLIDCWCEQEHDNPFTDFGAVKDFVGSSVEAFSDLNESINAVEVTLTQVFTADEIGKRLGIEEAPDGP